MIRRSLISALMRPPAVLRADDVETRVPFGIEAIDMRLGGGLAPHALHEFFATEVGDSSAAAGFATMLAMRACPAGRPLLWVRERRCASMTGHLHAAGLVELGFDANDLILVDAPDTLAVLRAGADIVKCGHVGAVVIEPWGKAPLYDLTASRRLSMAAASSGVLTLVVRTDARPAPSAAQSRWQIGAAPSSPLAADAPGNPAFDITLLRHRGGISGIEARLEWNREVRCFAPLPGGVPAVPAVGTHQAPTFAHPLAA